MIRQAIALTLVAATPVSAQTLSVSEVFDLLCGRTIQFYDTGVGNQIEYSDAGGNAYLWFNGLPDVLQGTWEVVETPGEEVQGGITVCYEYRLDSLGQPGEVERHCHDADAWLETITQEGVWYGDRYGLIDGTPPFLLRAHPFQTLDALDEDFPELPPERNCGVPVA